MKGLGVVLITMLFLSGLVAAQEDVQSRMTIMSVDYSDAEAFPPGSDMLLTILTEGQGPSDIEGVTARVRIPSLGVERIGGMKTVPAYGERSFQMVVPLPSTATQGEHEIIFEMVSGGILTKEVITTRVESIIVAGEPIENEIVAAGAALTGAVVAPAAPTQCMGCMQDGVCLPVGTRVLQDNGGVFCSAFGTLQLQRETGTLCQNDYECSTNECSSSVCTDLRAELEEARSLMQRLFRLFDGILE